MKRLIAAAAVLCLLLCGCSPVTEERYFFAMDTIMTFRLEGDDGTAFSACENRIRELEQLFSATLPESEIYQLNQSGAGTLSEETLALIQAGLSVSAETDQAFCLSLYPVTRLWNFTGENPRVPAEEELEALRSVVDDTRIQISGSAVTLPEGGAIDLGGIAKGYAAEQLAALLAELGIEHYYFSLGGNVQVGGGKPDGSLWKIGVADPDGDGYVGILSVADGAVVTSGGYQRNFTLDGKTYHHILDRVTLAPAESGLKSVTIVAESGTRADALSTALFVMGEEKAEAFHREHGGFEYILITDENQVVVSTGLQASFTLENSQYDYK